MTGCGEGFQARTPSRLLYMCMRKGNDILTATTECVRMDKGGIISVLKENLALSR